MASTKTDLKGPIADLANYSMEYEVRTRARLETMPGKDPNNIPPLSVGDDTCLLPSLFCLGKELEESELSKPEEFAVLEKFVSALVVLSMWEASLERNKAPDTALEKNSKNSRTQVATPIIEHFLDEPGNSGPKRELAKKFAAEIKAHGGNGRLPELSSHASIRGLTSQ